MGDPQRSVPMPAHIYVPGFSPRHPEGWFDDIKASVTEDVAPQDLHKTYAFQAGRAYLEAGYYWECHEVLEAVWMQTKDPSPERDMVLALIQLANARLKVLMGRPRAALRLCDMVEAHLSRCPTGGVVLGLLVSDVVSETKETRNALKHEF